MEKNKVIRLSVTGMSCGACEMKIEKKVSALDGVQKVKASYGKGAVDITFDENRTTSKEIVNAIQSLGYQAKYVTAANVQATAKVNFKQLACIILLLFGASFLINRIGGFAIFNAFPQATTGMSYAALFLVGLFTSVHCVAMCGGINLSQCVPQAAKGTGGKMTSFRPSFLYNLGRVISYTVVGGIVGAIGSVVSFSGMAKGIVAILAGVFMIIMGLNMLNLFPWLRRFAFHLPRFLTRGIDRNKHSNSPLYVGLLNGLMPCGPLQAMQLFALSTGSPVSGALSMFFFSLGTVPLMFGFGALSSLLSKKFTDKMLRISAVLVVILGVVMFSNGMGLSGFNIGFSGASTEQSVAVVEADDESQTVTIELSPRSYAPITVKKGIPVKWIINADTQNINGCNNEILIPKYNISKQLVPGENVIEFTPTEAGTIPYSCWMGMIRSQITVTD